MSRRPLNFLRNLFITIGAVVPLAVGAATAADPDNCLICHQYLGLSRFDRATGEVHLFYVDPDYTEHLRGPHAKLACTDCHARSEVMVVPHEPVSPVNCTQTCHLVGSSGLPQQFSHEGVAAMLEESIHTSALLSDVSLSEGSVLSPGQSQCLYCHDEPLFRTSREDWSFVDGLTSRTFDRCDVCHTGQLQVDIRYYLNHVVSRLRPARPTLETAQVCAVCHSDPKVMEAHDLPNSVASFVRSFHGKAALLGEESTANCLSCHIRAGENVHLMLGHEDPESAVHPTRLADSCSTTECHPGAAKSLGQAGVHLDLPTIRGSAEFILAALFILLTIVTFGPSALLAILELLQLVVGREPRRHHEVRALAEKVMADPRGRRKLKRVPLNFRVQHWLLAVLFVALAITGFPMKFADEPWSRTVVDSLGGLATTRLVHHWAGLALVVGLLLHTLQIALIVIARARRMNDDGQRQGVMRSFFALPLNFDREDGRKFLDLLAYLLFLRKERPMFGRFSIKEKFEYFGVFWGTVLLGVTGLLLWGEQVSSHFLSGRIFNLAIIAHTYEAFLAVIHVGVLHTVAVMLSPNVFPLSPAMLSGNTPVDELVEAHTDYVVEAARETGISTEGADS